MTVLVSRKQILAKVRGVAEEILAAGYDDPLFVSLLNGAVPFTVDLMRALHEQAPAYYPTVRYMFASTYGTGTEAREPHIDGDNFGEIDLATRIIIILDDVLDTGRTYVAVREHLVRRGAGAANIKLAVLAQKDVPRPADIRADHCGFTLENKWLYGAGMDGIPGEPNREAGRWLPDICTSAPLPAQARPQLERQRG